jgi:hypothetical protein
MRTLAFLVLLALMPLTRSTGQEPTPTLEPGRRVRVTAPAADMNEVEATVVGLQHDTLALAHEAFYVDAHGRRSRDTLVAMLPVAAITNIAVHAGTRSHKTTGILIGGASGLLIGALSTATYYSSDEDGYGGYVLGGAAVTGAIGAGLGWLIGSLVRSDRWEEIPLDRVQVGLVAARDGVGMGVRVRF